MAEMSLTKVIDGEIVRLDGRHMDELRPVTIQRKWTSNPEGSVTHAFSALHHGKWAYHAGAKEADLAGSLQNTQ